MLSCKICYSLKPIGPWDRALGLGTLGLRTRLPVSGWDLGPRGTPVSGFRFPVPGSRFPVSGFRFFALLRKYALSYLFYIFSDKNKGVVSYFYSSRFNWLLLFLAKNLQKR